MTPHYIMWINELIWLGVPRYHASLTGLSRKGYWHLSKTLSTNCGLGNEFLKGQGLTSIRTLWIRIQSGYGPMISLKRQVRTRIQGGVGRDGEMPSLTRLNRFILLRS